MTCKGRFIFSRELGSGSFGQVYLAYDLAECQFVAIKNVLNNKFAREEVKLLKELQDSPYILKFVKEFLFYDDKGIHRKAITTEYCDNGDLQNILESGTFVSQTLKRQWLLELSQGIEYIHSKDIVHRDIKPQNILVDYYNRLRIADVGLAVHCRSGIKQNLFRNKGSRFASYVSELAGTQPYMAPEVFNEHYNDTSDVYSLGLVFIMILERPKHEYPYAVYKCKKYSLGELQHSRKLAKSPLKYLVFPVYEATDQEVLLINNMLASDYHSNCRLPSSHVVKLIQNIHIPLEYVEEMIALIQAGKATLRTIYD